MTQTSVITEFAGETLPGNDAEILLAEYGHVDPAQWRADAELIAAACINKILPTAEVIFEPWRELYQAAKSKPDQVEDAIYEALKLIQPPLQTAVFSFLSLMIGKLATRTHAASMGNALGPNKKRRITTNLLQAPDPTLRTEIENELINQKSPGLIRNSNAANLMLNWLQSNGRFLKSEEALYYLYNNEHRLFDLDTESWEAFLHTLTGVNPGASVFVQLAAAAKTAAILNAENVPVMKFAHYDDESQILRVSRFDGVVYVLDGTNILTEANGAGPVVFYDFPSWRPYSVEETNYDYLAHIGNLPSWRASPDLYSWVFQVWIQTLFFTELCPTRPIIVLLGEKGSGKSMALRLLQKLLFGPFADISGIPDKPDAFAVAASHYHLYALDNMDTLEPWMRDKLARISTGATDEYRKLYTSKELGIIRYRTWLAITARTPDTLRRDDLADRIVILPLQRLSDDQRGRELDFMQWATANRNQFWGCLLKQLNLVVAALRAGSIPVASPLRMADWEALGRIISMVHDKTDQWDTLVNMIKSEQGNFLAEGEIVIEAIDVWLTNPGSLLTPNVGRWVTARELYVESQQLLFPGSKPDSDWPRSVKSFGWRLKNIGDFLKDRYGMKTMDFRNQTKYCFDHA